MMKYYAGIGARKTPKRILNYIQDIAEILAEKDYVLRSGGSYGSDSAFEIGCNRKNGKKEIYLPYKKYENNESELYDLSNISDAIDIAKAYHPNWLTLSKSVQQLFSRNVYQVLGKDLSTPSLFLICWLDSNGSSGTTYTVKLARTYNIPVFNLRLEKNLDTIAPSIFVEHIEQIVAEKQETSKKNILDIQSFEGVINYV